MRVSALRSALIQHGEEVEGWWAPFFDSIKSSRSLRSVKIDLGGRVQAQHEQIKGRIARGAAEAIASRLQYS